MSREAERLAARFRPPYKMITETFSGTDSYVRLEGTVYHSRLLRHVERATFLQGTLGWEGEVVTGTVSGNAFTLRIYTSALTAGASGRVEPITGADLSDQAFTLLLEGL